MLDVTIHTGRRTILIDEEKLCFVTDFKVSTSKKTTLKQEVYRTTELVIAGTIYFIKGTSQQAGSTQFSDSIWKNWR